MNGPELEWNEKQKKGGLKSAFRELTPGKLFVFCVLFGAAWCVLYYFFNPNAGFEALFFRSGEDMFMDFFNSVRDAAQFARVYTERRVIYPPLANLLFLIFSRFLPASYTDTAFAVAGSACGVSADFSVFGGNAAGAVCSASRQRAHPRDF